MALEATGSLSKARAALAERQAVGDGEAATGPESPALPCTDRWDVVGCRFSAPRPSPAQPGGSRGSWSWPRHSRALYPALPAGPPGLWRKNFVCEIYVVEKKNGAKLSSAAILWFDVFKMFAYQKNFIILFCVLLLFWNFGKMGGKF